MLDLKVNCEKLMKIILVVVSWFHGLIKIYGHGVSSVNIASLR